MNRLARRERSGIFGATVPESPTGREVSPPPALAHGALLVDGVPLLVRVEQEARLDCLQPHVLRAVRARSATSPGAACVGTLDHQYPSGGPMTATERFEQWKARWAHWVWRIVVEGQ